MRSCGTTQVLKLDAPTLLIQSIATTGASPGWISRHCAEEINEHVILVVGGNVLTGDSYIDNRDIFEIDIRAMKWRRHGDLPFPL